MPQVAQTHYSPARLQNVTVAQQFMNSHVIQHQPNKGKYMKVLIFVSLAILFSSSQASDKSSIDYTEISPLIEIYFTDTPASEVANYANLKCKGHIKPIILKNPDAQLSINFEKIECRGVVEILIDFDSRVSET